MTAMNSILTKSQIAWASYDFANSAYALSVMTLFYPIFFVQFVADRGGESLWGISVAFSIFLVALLAPLLGTVVDRSNSRKAAFLIVTGILILLIFMLAFTGNMPTSFGVSIFIITNTMFGIALFLYDSLMIDAKPDRVNLTLLSGFGWALGYIGGPLCVLIIWVLGGFEVPATYTEFRDAFLIVGAFFAAFAILSIRHMASEVQKPINSTKEAPAQTDKVGRSLKETLFWLPRNYRSNKNLIIFLIAIYFITDGLVTVTYFISLFAKDELGLTLSEIVWFLTLAQMIAIPATILFSYIARKLGEIPILVACSLIWTVIVLLLYTVTDTSVFYLIALLTGLVVGSTPSIARGFLGRITPIEHRAEVFGFNAFAGRLASVIGPVIFVIVTGAYGFRAGMLSVVPFFLIGSVILIYLHMKTLRSGDEV